jgi:hypothetical protein
MFDRFKRLGPSAGRLLRTLVVALLPAVVGCDEKPQWHGVGTDSGHARPAPNPDVSHGSNSHGKPR